MTSPLFKCEYCKKGFHQERHYQRHTCTERKRALEMETYEGKLAYAHYRTWFKKRRLKPSDNALAFTKASTYTAFQKFARWVRMTGIVDVELYIALMVERGLAPSIWTHDDAYAFYLKHLDAQVPPLKQADVTLETLTILAEGMNVKLNEVFSQLEMPQVLELIQQRRLSPWILFSMKSFKRYCEQLSDADRKYLMDGIGVSAWVERFNAHPNLLIEMRGLAEGLEL